MDVSTRLRRDVEALANLNRRTGSAGEQRSAEWIAGRLAEAGARDITTSRFRDPVVLGACSLSYLIFGVAVGLLSGWWSRLLSTAVTMHDQPRPPGHHLPAHCARHRPGHRKTHPGLVL
jgi:hypothetical protein